MLRGSRKCRSLDAARAGKRKRLAGYKVEDESRGGGGGGGLVEVFRQMPRVWCRPINSADEWLK